MSNLVADSVSQATDKFVQYAKKYPYIPDVAVDKVLRGVAGTLNNMHEDTIVAAHKVVLMLMDPRGANSGLLKMFTQSGKTSVMLLIAAALPRLLKQVRGVHETVGAYIIINISLSDIRDKTWRDLRAAGFESEIDTGGNELWYFDYIEDGNTYTTVAQVVMLSCNAREKLRDAEQAFKDLGIERQIFLLDEAHVAVGTDQMLATYLRETRESPFDKSKWVAPENLNDPAWNPDTFVLGISATGVDKYIVPHVACDAESYFTWHEPTSPEYYGPRHIVERLKQWDWKSSNKKYRDELDSIDDPNRSGNILVRLPSDNGRGSKEAKRIEKLFVSESKKRGWSDPLTYACDTSKGYLPIKGLNGKLKSGRSLKKGEKQVIFIKDAIGAGSDLDYVGNILAVFELRYRKEEAQFQSIGRYTGWKKDRREADFPIYCNKASYVNYLHKVDLIKEGHNIPRVSNGGATARREQATHKIIIVDKNGNEVEYLDPSMLCAVNKPGYNKLWHEKYADDPEFVQLYASGAVAHRDDLIQLSPGARGTDVWGHDSANIASGLLGESKLVNPVRLFNLRKRVPSNSKYAADKRKLLKLPIAQKALNKSGYGLCVHPKHIKIVYKGVKGTRTPFNT